ncbi:MAG: hypothetical protein ABIH26_07110 [Candidatus Eisenbacteria bacterium]
MQIRTVLALSLVLVAAPAMANVYEDASTATFEFIEPVAGDVWGGARDVLYDNGPFVNMPGGGWGGADASVLQNSTLLMNTLGFGHQVYYNYLVTDDFTVPAGDMWSVETITFFAYQTGAPTSPSTMTAVHVQIWDNPPDMPGANLVFGDLVTNRLTGTAWSNCYRVTETTLTATNRPIMADVCSAPVVLGPGTYWVAWQTDGTLTSGPWAPPIAIWGQPTTGNGEQSLDGGVTYAPAVDSGSLTPQGFPFIISGTNLTGTEESTWGQVKALFR